MRPFVTIWLRLLGSNQRPNDKQAPQVLFGIQRYSLKHLEIQRYSRSKCESRRVRKSTNDYGVITKFVPCSMIDVGQFGLVFRYAK